MSKMIIIAGTIDLEDPTQRDAALVTARRLQQKTRDEEPGCLAYVFFRRSLRRRSARGL